MCVSFTSVTPTKDTRELIEKLKNLVASEILNSNPLAPMERRLLLHAALKFLSLEKKIIYPYIEKSLLGISISRNSREIVNSLLEILLINDFIKCH